MAYYLCTIEFENEETGKKTAEKAIAEAESTFEAHEKLARHLEDLMVSAEIKSVAFMNKVNTFIQ